MCIQWTLYHEARCSSPYVSDNDNIKNAVNANFITTETFKAQKGNMDIIKIFTDSFNDVLITFLGLEHGSCIAVNGGGELG